MPPGPRRAAPRIRHESAISIVLAVVGAAVTQLAFREWFVGWMVGLLVGLFGGRAVARRRPDLADPRAAEGPERWQWALIVVLAIAVTVALVATLTNGD